MSNKIILYPNPDIEMRLIVQVIDVHSKVIKTVVTLLVMRIFMTFLSASRTCASIVFSILGFGLYTLLTLLVVNTAIGGGFQQQTYIKAANTGKDDVFGAAMASSDDTLVIGAWGETSNTIGVNGDKEDKCGYFS